MLFFNTNTDFDIRAFSMMGVSAKSSENAIGRFGTGLKYAVAIILRNSGKISIRIGNENYSFSIRDDTFRGKAIQTIYMNETLLPFSIEYGKNWERWAALRELFSNTLDEGGSVTTDSDNGSAVCISVLGFDHEWETRADWYLSTQNPPDFSCEKFDLWRQPIKKLFYQNFSVHSQPDFYPFTVNFKGNMYLTEDRRIGYLSERISEIENELACNCNDPAVLNNAVCSDMQWSYACHNFVSAAFCSATKSIHASPEAKLLARQKEGGSIYETIPFQPEDEAIVQSLLPKLRHIWRDAPLNFKCANLPDGTLGMYVEPEKQIYLSPSLFLETRAIILLCLIEECIHALEGHDDYSRGFQTFTLKNLAQTLLKGTFQ